MSNSTLQKLAAEFIGTGVLVFLGAGSVPAAEGYLTKVTAFSMAQLGMISFGFMFAVVIMIYAIGHISGCHINPAVTVGQAVTGKFPWRDVPGYVGAQLAGACAGALAIAGVLGEAAWKAANPLGAVDYGSVSFGRATFAEAIGTALLVFVVFGVFFDKRAVAGWGGLAVGGAVFAIILVVAPATGAALNPARYVGTVFMASALGGTVHFNHIAPYLIGEFGGGIVGALAYQLLATIRRADVEFEDIIPTMSREEVSA